MLTHISVENLPKVLSVSETPSGHLADDVDVTTAPIYADRLDDLFPDELSTSHLMFSGTGDGPKGWGSEIGVLCKRMGILPVDDVVVDITVNVLPDQVVSLVDADCFCVAVGSVVVGAVTFSVTCNIAA